VLIRCQCGECAIRLVISIASCIEMVDLKIYDPENKNFTKNNLIS